MNQVIEAEKGRPTVEKLHIRLRTVEIVLLISLFLNVITGYLAMHSEHKATQVQEQTGVRP